MKMKYTIALLTALLSVSAFAADKDEDKVQNVNVLSMPAVTIEAQSSVTVESLPAVDVNSLPAVDVNSLPAVDINSLPAVTIAAMPEVLIEQYVREPFSFRIGTACGSCLQTTFVNDEDTIMVIENIEVWVAAPPATQKNVTKIGILPPDQVNETYPVPKEVLHLLMTPTGFITRREVSTGFEEVIQKVAHRSQRVYVMPGDGVAITIPSISGSSREGDGAGLISFSGYRLPVDSPSLAP